MKLFIRRNWVGLFVAFFAVLCVIAMYMTSDNGYHAFVQEENTEIQPSKIECPKEGAQVFTLPIVGVSAARDTLMFYSNHQEIYVYYAGELIYSCEKSKSIFGGTTGAIWNIIPLSEEMTELQVEVVQVYPQLQKQEIVFEMGNTREMYREVMSSAPLELTLTFAIILIGIILVSYWLLVYRSVDGHKEIFYLGLFAVVFGVWNFGETQFALFMFDNRPFWSYLAFTCLMIMCLPALFFFREFLEPKDKYLYKVIAGYIVGETIVCQCLHLTGIAGVKETRLFTNASVILLLFYLFVAIIMSIRQRCEPKKIIINLAGLCILVISTITDLIAYYTDVLRVVGAAKIGFLLYILILGMETTRIARKKMQQEQKMELLKEMAVKDFLSGCYNRNAYHEDILKIEKPEGYFMIAFDLNNLKKCNDSHGHRAGDRYISDAAELICEVFGELGKVYRVGGDEFCILAKQIRSETIEERKRQLNSRIAEYCQEHNTKEFGIACGYAQYELTDVDLEVTRHRADLCMYEDKKEGKAN